MDSNFMFVFVRFAMWEVEGKQGVTEKFRHLRGNINEMALLSTPLAISFVQVRRTLSECAQAT